MDEVRPVICRYDRQCSSFSPSRTACNDQEKQINTPLKRKSSLNTRTHPTIADKICIQRTYFHSDASNRRHSRFLIGLRVVWKAETHDATPKVTDAGEKRRYSYVTVSDMRMGSKSERAKQLERKGERNCV
ncbi:hypothetical protein V9T40_010566 [Parthenolecanium corni]|uniref:Uncharacterized protein n=1 Tax=Parthenolecanium corni TaxID=536013 RepID=A0AAN9T4E7_9HEMI